MAYTYTGDLGTDLDKIRFYINDVVENSGPQPSGGSYTDEEIAGVLAIEGTWQRSVAAVFEVLASSWANHADLTVGPRSIDYSQVSASYRERAQEWRDGYGSAAGGAGYVFVTRVDAYSDDIAADEV